MRSLELEEAKALKKDVRAFFIDKTIDDCDILDVIIGPYDLDFQHEFHIQYMNSDLSDLEMLSMMGINKYTLILIVFVDVVNSNQFYNDFEDACNTLNYPIDKKYLE